MSLTTVNPTWGTNARGEAIALLSQTDLVNVHTQDHRLRAFCPVHGSDHQASLSVNLSNGFGVCFSCGVRVLIRELNTEVAERLQHRSPSPTLPPPVSPRVSSPPKSPSSEWQTRESDLLRFLSQSGAARLDRAEAVNAQVYLKARCIPIEVAATTHVGYLEVGAAKKWGERLLRRWEDRILFPLQTQDTSGGFAGRLLTGWQQCVDEDTHKARLKQQGLRRWLKTNSAGWFWTPLTRPIAPLIVVEGPFDRLALLAAGFDAEEVMALVGTALPSLALPTAVQSLLLALDDDVAGREAAQRLVQQLQRQQVHVECCLTSSEFHGKDWSALWRQYGADGMSALYVHHALLSHNL